MRSNNAEKHKNTHLPFHETDKHIEPALLHDWLETAALLLHPAIKGIATCNEPHTDEQRRKANNDNQIDDKKPELRCV